MYYNALQQYANRKAHAWDLCVKNSDLEKSKYVIKPSYKIAHNL